MSVPVPGNSRPGGAPRSRLARLAAAPLAAAVLALAAPQVSPAADEEPAPVRENCARIEETKIQGPICKGFIRNDCTHAIDMTVRYEMKLRRVVVLPVMAEGPSMEYQDAGEVEREQDYSLDAGQARWFVHKNEGEGIEVANCKIGFSYKYEE